jgi:acetyl esterase/lipase
MKTEVISLTKDQRATLTCYIQDASADMPNTMIRPAVLIMPGGGYNGCSDREAEPVALAYMAQGFQAFVLRYTGGVGSSFSQALADAERAMEIIARRAAEWGVDKDAVAAVGFSAGGHLAAALGVMGKSRPSALVLCYPCILESMNEKLAFSVPGLADQVGELTPPAFLFATSADEIVPIQNTLAFAAALSNAKIPFETHIFQEGRHGLSLAKPRTCSGESSFVNALAAQWFDMSAAWLHGILETSSSKSGISHANQDFAIDEP